MNDGKVEQIGTPDELRSAPVLGFVADFLAAARPAERLRLSLVQ